MNGAKLAYQKLHDLGITQLILKKKSFLRQSDCLRRQFFRSQKEGVGVASAYFQQQGMTVLSDVDWLAEQEENNGD